MYNFKVLKITIYIDYIHKQTYKEGIEMAQPKRRWSKARTGLKRSTWKLENKNLVECPQCHEQMMQHRVCPSCGYYNGKKVVSVDTAE